MRSRRLKLTPILIIFLLITACNMPIEAPPEPANNDQVATISAITASAESSQLQPTPLFTPLPTLRPTFTPVYTTPMVSVTTRSNCRTGPAKEYELVTAINPGELVNIVGSYPPLYWLVETDKGVCWLYGEFATPVGSFSQVPTVTPPPTPTRGPLEAPVIQKWDFFCNLNTGQADITIIWSDVNNSESGYRVYRNGSLITSLPANSTQFTETVALLSGQSADYTIEAFSPDNTASSSVVTITCP